MAYTIHKSDGTAITVPDNTIDAVFYNPQGGSTNQGLGLQLVGRNVVGYGAAIAQNILQSAENFSNSTVPSDSVALQGQLWFNKLSSTAGNLYVRSSGALSGGITNWNQLPTLDNNGNLTIPGKISAGGGFTDAVTFASLSQAEAGISTILAINPNTLVGTINSILISAPVPSTTNISGGVAGSIPYQLAPSITTLLSPGTNGEVLTLINGLPRWSSLSLSSASIVTTITGTTNQIIASSSTGNIILSLPQNINSGASPVFNASNFTGNAVSLSIGGNAATASSAINATTASEANTLNISGTASTFNWVGEAGQPNWLFGGNTPSTIDVYNPSNFNVNYANSAGTSNALNSGNGYTIAGLQVNGNIVATGTIAGTSDIRLKTNWQNLPVDFLEKLVTVKYGTYDRTDIVSNQAGISAQDMQLILPQVVLEDKDGYLSMAYGNAAMVAVIELTKRVLELEARLESLLK